MTDAETTHPKLQNKNKFLEYDVSFTSVFFLSIHINTTNMYSRII